ncbi:MAG: hypothetical protein RIR73_7 [Chloroflexota bacterium]|jgi:hypothetical protein
MTKKIQLSRKLTSHQAADKWVENRRTVEPEPIKRLTLDIPESLHRKIKTDCAQRGTKMAEDLRELLMKKYGDC